MESNSSSYSAPLRKSRIGTVRIFRITKLCTPKTAITFVPNRPCPPPPYTPMATIEAIRLRTSYFTGGDPLVRQTPLFYSFSQAKSISFRPSYTSKTVTDGVYKVRANLHLLDRSAYVSSNSTHRRLRLVHYRGPRFPMWKKVLGFRLDGFFRIFRKLCMVGSGLVYPTGNVKSFGVVLKLNYPQSSNINHSLITGTLESLNDKHASNYFQPISLLALSRNMSYEYTLIEKGKENGCIGGYSERESLNLNKSGLDVCSVIGNQVERFELEYGSDCNGINCNPLGGSVGYVPDLMYYYKTRCTDGRKMQVLLGFPNTNYSGSRFPFVPSTTFIAEGVWDEKENQLCGVACRILNVTESLASASVGDCSKTCAKWNIASGKGKKYPNEYSLDMRFDIQLMDLNQCASEATQTESSVKLNSSHSSIQNISYRMSFSPPPDFKFGHDTALSKEVVISAEGTYDRDTGVLCMIGCRHLGSKNQNFVKNGTLDCEIMINIQFSSLNGNGGRNVKGSIATVLCKRHPNVLPFISIVMLVVLTVGHMIPLLLNFEALFVANRSQQNVFLGSGGWLEVNEVIVRVVTMVAFLLQLRLLQQTWSARQDGRLKGLWVSEMKVNSTTPPQGLLSPSSPAAFFTAAFSLGGPQVLCWFGQGWFSAPADSVQLLLQLRGKALAPFFYIGTTMVRLLPHAYDLYRAHSSTWYLDISYIYANHRMDFYSTAWNIIIPCGGLLFAVLIFLQQRFGGRCILPKRFRESSVYEKVPVISNDDL
ncbi:hypothetical protein FNV43_RR07254 [Rhamnella rubrinervis]|uniref:RING-type E3 ubiquitin transferase n=1 Tax=Rhamnella rubrinervis TaxID=2594499 RepID=A0A8K0MM70_9ROSA|nr:hypothetical protein FNV43_RR07254 [Rhamnella rubrinervis]